MGQMAMAMGKLGTLEGFLRQISCKCSFSCLNMWKSGASKCCSGGLCNCNQHALPTESSECLADNLRQQTLQQMHRILTTRQSARALLAISEYFSRLRALSSLWLARPREQ
ncbi:hypothetical protein KY290_006128 [Solanum tuberosum]|uniref:DOG1 domain-containing protein n=1 Tax=Solanum tuberosum TaxID=4113 RepID=A0ABQ7WHI4_SOLTU|nr:hypothetical protein KY284_006238 [Solanum tuberosum]KAH0779701.1 hypothetical protein KY290_006128 [Solanum tuberosum]